jgi:hypothetical protein
MRCLRLLSSLRSSGHTTHLSLRSPRYLMPIASSANPTWWIGVGAGRVVIWMSTAFPYLALLTLRTSFVLMADVRVVTSLAILPHQVAKPTFPFLRGKTRHTVSHLFRPSVLMVPVSLHPRYRRGLGRPGRETFEVQN